MNTRNTTVGRYIVLVSLVIAGSRLAHGQTTVYSDDFSGAGGPLNGAAPDVRPGTETWTANNAFNDNGTINGTNEGSALLPFNPVVNATYTLSMDVPFTNTDRWIALGFANDQIDGPGTSVTNDRFSNANVNGIAWMLFRNSANDAQDVEIFAGNNTQNPITDDGRALTFPALHQLKVVLNTTGNGTSFTADFFIDGTTASSGPQTIVRNIDDLNFVGLSYDNTTVTPPTFDNFLLTQQITGPLLNQWNVNGGGNFSVAGNWTQGTPTAGATVQFGAIVTAPNSPALINMDAPATLGEIQFSNGNAQYIVQGASTITLNGAATVSNLVGNHEIAAMIAGSAGLKKLGGGELTLSANNTYTGLTDIQAGVLRVRNPGAVDGSVNIAAGASMFFQGNGAGGGFNGTFAGDIQGAGEVDLSGTLTTEVVTFNSAKTYTGATVVRGGTLAISNSGALGAANADLATRTLITGNLESGKLALSGSIAVGTEVLSLDGRQGAALNAVHLTSSGNNSWAGNVRGNQAGGSQYNIESTSGTLTLSGIVSAFDDAAGRTFVFSGAGNTNIAGKLTDEVTNGDTGIVTGVGTNNNVNVVKRGGGTLTISTAAATTTDYWRGTTTIEGGTLEVISNGASDGELQSSAINIRSGATLDVDHFGTYSLQAGQRLSGAGTITATGKTVAIGDDNSITPGDSRGTLTINGNATLTQFSGGGTLDYELGDTPGTIGGTENDLVQINGSLTASGTPTMNVVARPVDGKFGAGNYRLINHTTGAAINVSGFTAKAVSNTDADLNPRQTFGLASSAGQVNLTVTGASQSKTWTGSAGNTTWDVATSNNWTGGTDQQFRDLDDVAFNNTATSKNVVVNSSVSPGSATFSATAGNTYTFTGTGGITGYGAVNVSSGTVQLNNLGNNYLGTTSVASGARLEMVSASTGGITANGTLSVGSTLTRTVVDSFNSAGLSEYTDTRVHDNHPTAGSAVIENNVTFTDNSGALVATYGGTVTAAEQHLLLRDDIGLAVGQTLYADVTMATATAEMDLGIAVSATKTPTAVTNADITPADTRTSFNWASVSVRPSQDSIRVNRSIGGTLTTGANVIGGVAETTVRKLLIERKSTTDFTLGFVDSNLNRRDNVTISIPAADVGAAIGFYADLRAVGGSLASLDNLQLVTGRASNTLNVNGNFSLPSSGTLELDISEFGFSTLNVSGVATLDGTISVESFNGFTPTAGTQFILLSATGGITDLGITYSLPASFSAAVVGNNLVLTYGLQGDYNQNGVVDAADYVVWRNNPAAFGGDPGGYTTWRGNFGRTSGSGTGFGTGGVPEPASLVLILGASGLVLARSRFRLIV